MRLIFDALGSTERSGGMRLHSTELIGAWLRLFPEDDVTVVGGSWTKAEFGPRGATVVKRSNESVVGRATGQLLFSPFLRVKTKADYVVSLSPIVSPLVPRRRAVCFQHDWRHKKNPHEFPTSQRWYRYLWQVSAAHASMNVCISQKAADETVEYVPRARTVVVANGYDHARDWPAAEREPGHNYIVTFGHHNNKRPELLIDALSLVRDPALELVVLGATGVYREELRARSEQRGVANRVQFPGFVDDAEYQRWVSGARIVALVSSDEGFGLPVAEAQYLGIPAVVTDDSGMDAIFGEYPLVSAVDPASLATTIETALTRPFGERDTSAHSWDDAARMLRKLLTSEAERPHRSGPRA